MATAVAPKPSAPHQQKMKRPTLPAVQTNGVHSSNSSRSPSVSSKRPPGFKHPPTPTVNGDTNGVGPRLSNRRKESQKPGETQGRPNRTGRIGQDGERRAPRRMMEPYVKTQSHILKRYRNKPPSLIIHLHPTHFRFDTQDGSFSYNSPMKFVLEHLKSQTVPHDMMEELNVAGTKFYEGCLIVQVQDHRSSSGASSTSANAAQNDSNNVPFSIHNYNEYLTPSPYADYPTRIETPANGPTNKANSQAGEPSGSKEKQHSKGPTIFHVVLFPTPLSIHEEVIIQANTVDPKQNNRKQSTAVPRTPASATMPTPSSAIPPTPSVSGPPMKKQKMTINGNEIHGFESKLIQSTVPPLFLEPVGGLEDAHRVVEGLTDSQHKEDYPAPKVKKRTVAELAADEAIAAQEQDFMLIMDERYASGQTGAKAGATDGESGIPTFQPNFEQWQAIRNIRADHKERAAREKEAKAIREATMQANKLRLEQQERAAKQETERRAQQIAQDQQHLHALARQSEINRAMQAREVQRQALAAGQNQLAHGHGHPMPNGVSHAQKSSPIVRNMTPNANSSPMVGNIPMNVTSSGQGVTSSPARPPSAMQHGQPSGMGMARQISRQQGPSRTSTPQMNGTPAMPHATPVPGHAQTPRMPQGSPPMGSNASMNHAVMVNQHVNGQQPQFSPEQQHHMEQHRMQIFAAQRKQAQIQQLQQQRMQNGSPNPQMSPEQRNPAHMQNLQQQAALNQQRSTQEYQQSLRMHHSAMGNGPGAQPNMPNGASPPQQGHPQPRPQMQITPQQRAQLHTMTMQLYQSFLVQVAQKYGGNQAAIPENEKLHCEQRAKMMASEQMKKQLMLMQQKAQQQRQMQQMAAMNGMNGGMNGQGMQAMGMNGQQGNSSEQHRQAVMAGVQQMSQMPHMGGGGVQNLNGMPNINGMHNGHMNGGGMGGMQ